MAEVFFEQFAVMGLAEDLSNAEAACGRELDAQSNDFARCRQRYTRLYTEAETRVLYARTALEDAEGVVRAAQAHCDDAERKLGSAEDADERESALQYLRDSREELADAQIKLTRFQELMNRLSGTWAQHGQAAESALSGAEDGFHAYSSLERRGIHDLETFVGMMEQARSALYSGGSGGSSAGGIGDAAAAAGGAAVLAGAASAIQTAAGGVAATAGAVAAMGSIAAAGSAPSTGSAPSVGSAVNNTAVSRAAASKGGAAPGWCARNSMQAVSVDQGGQKHVSMRICGRDISFPCSKSGAARAFREAKRTGDQDLIARTYAMFEIETLREILELTTGEGAVQLGGYHRDVKGEAPAGYESHHIPSRSVQNIDPEWLPTIAISRDDHIHTSSYGGKQRKTYKPFLPDSTPNLPYRQEMSQLVGKGCSGYIEAVRDELYDLRLNTGHKYDGGISAYLDAVIDMLAVRGLPESR